MSEPTVELEDGTEAVKSAAEALFLQWLADHGATHEKISWPSRQTVHGVRGAVARADIETLEPMVVVPASLIISPPTCEADPEIGHVFAESPVFRGSSDKVLAVFLMHHMLKGQASFWFPYISMLPKPNTILEWSEPELAELHDRALVDSLEYRQRFLRAGYDRVMPALRLKYPELFPEAQFTFELYTFSIRTVLARAFGRRLPWLALVPFADCLNHSNVQTKYDYDVEGNGLFRLFPTGSNWYPKGSEVFNSYGRRNNEHLLTDYGFALLDNEHDTFSVWVQIPRSDPAYERRVEALAAARLWSKKLITLTAQEFDWDMLGFCRGACADTHELQEAMARCSSSAQAACALHQPLSAISELAALQHAASAIQAELERMPTTLDQDERLLASEGLPSRLRTALYFRMTKKRIASSQLAALHSMQAVLEAGSAEELDARIEAAEQQLVRRRESAEGAEDALLASRWLHSVAEFRAAPPREAEECEGAKMNP